MTTITTRSGKGSPLTNNEVDANFTNLNDDKVEASGDSMTGNLSFGDNNKAIFGAGSDLQIYHDSVSSHSIIAESGSGSLFLRGQSITMQNADGSKAYFGGNGDVATVYYGTQAKLATTSSGIDVTGTVTADGLTVDGDTLLKASGTNTTPLKVFSDNSTTNNTTTIEIGDFTGGGVYEVARASLIGQRSGSGNGGILTLTTAESSAGTLTNRINIADNGDINFYEDTGTTAKLTWDASAETLNFADNGKAIFGDGSDLQIYHDGSNSYVSDVGTGSLFLTSDGAGVVIEKSTGENLLFADNSTGRINLYHNNSVKLATTSTGVDITGTVTATSFNGYLEGGVTATPTNSSSATIYTASGSHPDYASTDLIIQARSSAARSIYMLTGTTTPVNRLKVDGSGDISFYESTGTTPKFFWDASAESLGINTTSPAYALDVTGNTPSVARFSNTGVANLSVSSSGSRASLVLSDSAGTNGAINSTTGDGIAFGIGSNFASNEAMRIDSSGNVLFGRSTSTNPASDTAGNGGGMAWWENNNDGFLAVSRNNPSSDAIVAGFNRTNGDGKIVGFNKDGSQVGSIAAEGGDLVVGTGNVGMRFFDAFNAIIPRVSGGGGSDAAIDIGLVSGGNNFRFKDLYLSSGLRGDTTFKNNAGTTEYARFDSSGNLLVGKTSLAGTAGVIAYNTGALEAIRDGAASLFVNRLTSDGAIAEFRKDGTTVGSIGVNSSVIPYFVRSAGSVGGIALGGGATKKVYPCDTVGAGADDALDLGDSSTRFKDLYLSGGVYVGGTTSANQLDDYEEGTFDFEFHDADSGGNTSSTTFTGYYTKIGRLVNVTVGPCNNISTSGMTSTGYLSFSLPFASSGNNRSVGSTVPSQVDFTTNRLGLNPFIANGVSRGQFQNYQNSGNRDGVRVSALTSGVSDFHSLTISYIT